MKSPGSVRTTARAKRPEQCKSMKTKTARIPGAKNTTTRAKIQPQTPPPSPLAPETVQDCPLPAGDVLQSCLCFYDRTAQKPVCKIPLNEDEFFNLMTMQAAPQFRGLYTTDIVAGAVRAWFNDSNTAQGFPGHIEALPEFALPTACPSSQCLVIFDRGAQQPVAKVPLTEDELNYLLNAPVTLPDYHDMTPAAIVASALRGFLYNTPLPAAVQSTAPAPVAASDSPLALVLFDNREGWSIEQIPVSLAQYQIIRQQTDGTSSTVADSLTVALRRITHPIPTEKLETAQSEISALLELFVTKFEHIARGELQFTGPESDSLACGFGILADSAEAHLKTAVEEVHQALYAPDAPPVPVAAAA